MIKNGIIALAAALLVLSTGCNQNLVPSASAPPQSTAQQPSSQQASSQSDNYADAIKAAYDDAFLVQARQCGYTDEMLYILIDGFDGELSLKEILAPQTLESYYVSATTPDGRYSLGGYSIQYTMDFMLIFDNTTQTFKMLPDIQSGYDDFGIIDDSYMFAGIVQLGGDTQPASIHIYRFDNLEKPVFHWDLTTQPMDGSSKTEKRLESVYYDTSSRQLIAAHCEIPTEWGGWANGDSCHYQLTVLDLQARPLFTLDTGIPLENHSQGIMSPMFENPNATYKAQENTVYFSLRDSVYMLDYQKRHVQPYRS